MLGLLVLAVLLGPFVYKVGINDIDFKARLAPPSWQHPMGTDDLGRDLLARVLYGGRISLAVGFASMVVAILVGVTIGAIAGISRGWVDAVLMWVTDLFLSLPQLPMLLVLIFFFRDGLKSLVGPEVGIFLLIVLVIGGFRWMPAARLVRAQFFSLREKEFVEAARALGASTQRQVVRHILPNALGPVIVAATIDVAAAIILESTLSFLGLGFPPDIPTWGRILFDAKDYLDIAVHWSMFPGLAIFITVLSISFIGDGLRDALDPQTGALAMALLEIQGLKTHFKTDDGWLHAVDGVDIAIDRGETVGIVGESGCGKSVTAKTVLKLIDMPPGKIVAGQVLWKGRDLVPLPPEEMQKIRAKEISIIFQEPMTSLNPVYTVGEQIAESLRLHEGLSRKDALDRAVEMLKLVRIPTPERRIDDYPHQFSGGMRQRVMIAIALACKPQLLIADEPTTALDVTIQAQILDLLARLKDEMGMAVMLITHAMGVVAEVAQRVVVMYAGKVVEEAPVRELFAHPRHPYTQGLIRSIPRIDLDARAQGAAGGHSRHRAQADRAGRGLPLRRALQARACRMPARPRRRCARWRRATAWPASSTSPA